MIDYHQIMSNKESKSPLIFIRWRSPRYLSSNYFQSQSGSKQVYLKLICFANLKDFQQKFSTVHLDDSEKKNKDKNTIQEQCPEQETNLDVMYGLKRFVS